MTSSTPIAGRIALWDCSSGWGERTTSLRLLFWYRVIEGWAGPTGVIRADFAIFSALLHYCVRDCLALTWRLWGQATGRKLRPRLLNGSCTSRTCHSGRCSSGRGDSCHLRPIIIVNLPLDRGTCVVEVSINWYFMIQRVCWRRSSIVWWIAIRRSQGIALLATPISRVGRRR